MDKDVKVEGRRAGRYTIVRVVSRSADVGTFVTLLWLWGVEWFVPAFAISASLNWMIDFWGQKLWAFENHDKTWQKLLREFGLYAALRLANMVAAVSCWGLLYSVIGLRWWTAALITAPIFWATWFTLSRWLFYGSVQDLGQLLKDLPRRLYR